MQRLDTSIRVLIETRELLEKKKAKLHLKSFNDLILMLLEKDEEFATFKKVKRKKSQNVPIATSKEKELPDICPDCLKFATCNNKWIRNPQKVKAHECFTPRKKCVFRTVSQDGKVDCAKDYARTGRIHKLTKEACHDCWERKKESWNKAN